MIDVIIPVYNSHDTIDRTLSSISLQSIADKLKVYIINDGSKSDYKEFVNFYKDLINITELSYEKNMGPGYARQYGIEHSKSKYIVFIDSDDTLYDSESIESLFNEIETKNVDFVHSNFYEEEDLKLKEHCDDSVWLHGKIYRREFIEKNNIKFNDSRNNEDNGFNTLVILNNPKECHLDKFTYIWLNNNQSITRKDKANYKYYGTIGYIYNMCWALKQKSENPLVSIIALASLYVVYLAYIEFFDVIDCNELISQSNELYSIYKLHDISFKEKLEILSLQFNNLSNTVDKCVLLKPYLSFNEFLELVGGK